MTKKYEKELYISLQKLLCGIFMFENREKKFLNSTLLVKILVVYNHESEQIQKKYAKLPTFIHFVAKVVKINQVCYIVVLFIIHIEKMLCLEIGL